MNVALDLRPGITNTIVYSAWKFPGGEIHVKLHKDSIKDGDNVEIITRLDDSDKIIFLALVVDTIRKDYKPSSLSLFIPYMPYQQADADFGVGECFSLKTITNLINSMNFDKVEVFHPHSIVTLALLNNVKVIDNSGFVSEVINRLINQKNNADKLMMAMLGDRYDVMKEIIILSADAGGYKSVFKTCEKIGFTGIVESCSKSRNHITGDITTKVPLIDENKIVLIVDDIALASNTFFNIRKELKNKQVYLAVSHGIFNDNIDKLEQEFTKVFTTNSIRDISISDKIEIINIF